MILRNPKFRGDQSNILKGKQTKICYIMSTHGICMIWSVWLSSRPQDDQYMQYWVAVTFKISSPHTMALLFQTSGFKQRFFLSPFLTFSPNLLDYALTWEFVQLILFTALSSIYLLGYSPHFPTSVFHFHNFYSPLCFIFLDQSSYRLLSFAAVVALA